MTHAEKDHAEPNYGMVWVGLLILTLVELWISGAPIPKVAIVVSLCALALAKAAMVAAYFMHLKFERYALIIVVMSPLLLSAILYIGLVPDATTHTLWLP